MILLQDHIQYVVNPLNLLHKIKFNHVKNEKYF